LYAPGPPKKRHINSELLYLISLLSLWQGKDTSPLFIMAVSVASKPNQASETTGGAQPAGGGGYKDVTATSYNEDLELKGGNGFSAAKVFPIQVPRHGALCLLMSVGRILCISQRGTNPTSTLHWSRSNTKTWGKEQIQACQTSYHQSSRHKLDSLHRD
jgi:hypothetical protein